MLRTRSLRLVLVAELLVVAAVALGLWALRRQTLDAELRHVASLAGAMAAQADATLDTADAALRATREELARGLLQPGSAEADALLRARLASLPRFRALSVTDATGHVVARSQPKPRDDTALAGRDFFRAARDAPAGSLHLSLPYPVGSGAAARQAIGVATDWRDAAGRFQGVLLLDADPEFLDRDFPLLAPSPDTHLAIYRSDLALIADGPGDNTRGRAPDALAASLWRDAALGTARAVALPDGTVRLAAARPLARSRLLLVVSRDRAEALDAWTNQAVLAGALAAFAMAVTVLLMLRSAREQAWRRDAQAQLAAEQARALRAFQAAQEGAWEWDPSTQQTHLSPRMKALLGLARDAPAARALHLHPTLHPEDVDALQAALLAHQQGHTGSFDHVFRVRRPDGGWRHVRARGLALQGEHSVLFSGTATDVSDDVRAREERARLEDQLARARRLEALGTLAGGVAHDFNNILASVLGHGELARDAAAHDPDQARRLDHVLQAGQRGRALVERILAFSRGAPRERLPMRLQPVVEEVLQMLQASLAPGIVLDAALSAPELVIRGDTTAVFEAVMNLCTNGLQAMPHGGRLSVRLAECTLPTDTQWFEGRLRAGRHARLSVQDEGKGIDAQALPHLFEPFFTTRTGAPAAPPPPGAPTAGAAPAATPRGTGLGLAVVHGVVTDLGGAIDVHSVPGQGARFDLYLPCSDDALPPALPASDAVAPGAGALPLGEGEAVLVVDDEPALVALAEELLAGLGYEPFGTRNPDEAWARFQAEPDRFALLLTDEVMPGRSGTALAAAVHGLRPQLPVVLASGWGGPQFEQRAAAAGIAVVVPKPLARADLARALHRALHGGGGGGADLVAPADPVASAAPTALHRHPPG